MTAVLENDTYTTGCDTFAQATHNTTRHKHILHACNRDWRVQRNGEKFSEAEIARAEGCVAAPPRRLVAFAGLQSTAALCLNDGDDRIPTACIARSSAR